MKNLNKTWVHWVHKLCTVCIALGWLLGSGSANSSLSLLFFGETEYPTKPEE